MELRHLRYFVALAEELSFTRAAKRVHVTQSTLSHQIKQLEEEVGHTLFDRISGRHVLITEAGETLLLSATKALREVDEGVRALKKSPHPLVGVLRIGATHTFNMSLIPDCVAAFLAAHPQMTVAIEELFASDIERQLTSGAIELGIAYEPLSRAKFTYEPLYIEEMVLVVSNDHALAGRKRVRLAELHRQALVLPTGAAMTRGIIDNALKSVGAEPVVAVEMNSAAGTLALVRRTKLGAIVSRLVTTGANDLRVIPLESPTPLRAPGLLTQAGRRISPAARAFIGIIRQTVLSRRHLDAR